MKKLLALVVILAVAAPSMAATTVSCAQVGSTAAFTISYLWDGTGSFPRAFALDVTTSVGTISGVVAAKVGESTAGSQGFGIFPGTIVIDSAGNVTNSGTPVAPAADPGALGGIGTAGATLELGSLYAAGGQPAAGAVLVTVSLAGVTSSATITIVPNTTRGGVVLEDATSIGAFTSTCVVNVAADCFYWPTGSSVNVTKFNRWVSSGKPACWCPPTSVTGLPTGGSGYQCLGDADGLKAAITNIRVGAADLTKLSQSWNKKIGDAGYNACADVDHAGAAITNIGVGSTDLTRVSQNWNSLDAALNTKLGVGGTGGFCGQAVVPAAYQ